MYEPGASNLDLYLGREVRKYGIKFFVAQVVPRICVNLWPRLRGLFIVMPREPRKNFPENNAWADDVAVAGFDA